MRKSLPFHLTRGISQFAVGALIFYGLVGRYGELSSLYAILIGLNVAAILISTLVVYYLNHTGAINSILINIILAGVFFVVGNYYSDQLTYEVIESVQVEQEEADKEAQVIAARLYNYGGWDFLWIYLVNGILAYTYLVRPTTSKEETESKFSDDVFKVKLGNNIHFLPFNEMEYVEASGNHIHIFSNGKKYTARTSIAELLDQADKDFLVRIHRSFVININLVRELSPTVDGHSVILSSGSEVKIGKHYKAALFELLGMS